MWKTIEPCQDILNSIKCCSSSFKSVVEKFCNEADTGIFIHKSPGGITYDEIIYLSQLPSELTKILNFEYNKFIIPYFRLNKEPIFTGFLLLCWQDSSIGANLNIDDFCQKIMDYYQDCSELTKAFKQKYYNIKFWRSYDPILAENNIKKASKIKAKTVSEISQTTLSSTATTSSESSKTN